MDFVLHPGIYPVGEEGTMKCATCKKAIQPRPENKYAPFCSERCRMADLNQWLNGSYAIPGQPVDISPEQNEPSQELPD